MKQLKVDTFVGMFYHRLGNFHCLKYFHWCAGATRIKCAKIKYTYTRYIVQLPSDEIFLTQKFKTQIISIS